MEWTQCLKCTIRRCIERDEIKPFPILSSSSMNSNRPSKSEQIKVYCICRLTYDGARMISCSKCAEWFHTSCVVINSRYDWFCSKCTDIWTRQISLQRLVLVCTIAVTFTCSYIYKIIVIAFKSKFLYVCMAYLPSTHAGPTDYPVCTIPSWL